MFLHKLSGCGFESRCSQLIFRYGACFEQGVPWHSGNYRVWIHSETRTWHDKNIQSDGRTLFFRMVFRKFSEITTSKSVFSQYDIFYNYEYFFIQSTFWSLFNHRQRSQSNQEQCSMCCSLLCFLVLLFTHYGPLQCFST